MEGRGREGKGGEGEGGREGRGKEGGREGRKKGGREDTPKEGHLSALWIGLHVVSDPVDELAHLDVDSRGPGLRTAPAPGHQAMKLPLTHQRTA